MRPAHPAPAPCAGWRIQVRNLVVGLAVLCLLLGALWYLRAPLLTAAAQVLIVNDPVPEMADAIVVLGGGVNLRPVEAARLYKLGIAPRILIAQSEIQRIAQLGLVPADGEVTARFLRELDVPSNAIEPFGTNLTSTYEEALAVREWLARSPARCILIPTDAFHSRRVSWIFGKILRGSGVDVRVIAIAPAAYSSSDWWHREAGLIAVQNEYLKFAYYRFKY